MLTRLSAIIRNTFIESIRQPIYVVLLLATAIILFMLPSATAYSMDDDNKFLIDMGLSTLFLATVLLAVFTSAAVVTNEIENKTVLTVISKPISRTSFVLGKFLGVSLAVGLAFWIMALVFFLTVRHGVMSSAGDEFDQPVLTFGLLAWVLALVGAAGGNYLYRWVFSSSFVVMLGVLLTLAAALVLVIGKSWHFQSPLAEFAPAGALAGGQRAVALVMVFEASLILTALAVAAATRLGVVMTLFICFGMMALGLCSGALFGPSGTGAAGGSGGSAGSAGPGSAATAAGHQSATQSFFYHIVPNFQFFWPSDALSLGHTITLGHLGHVSLYALLYIAAAMFLAVGLFQTREVG